ncbi:MAG: hypothetical protein J6Y32_03465 [Bacteroidales bacterium]|nr:hypothetical protein [Bacteroidales bacterium]
MLNLKEYLRRRILDRVSYKGPTGLVPLKGMKHATILLDTSTPRLFDFQESLRKFFDAYGIASAFYFLNLGKEETPAPQFSLPASTLSKNQLSGYTKRPQLDKFNPAFFKKCDIFVSFSREDIFPHKYLCVAIPADFKVGPFNDPEYKFNLVLSASDAPSMLSCLKDMLTKIA